MTTSAEWIRTNYHVPARRGGRVAYTGDRAKGRQEGTITAFRGPYVRIRLDGDKHPMPFHPTWELEYLPRAEWTLTPENVYQLWDLDVIRVFCKPHFAPAPAGHHVSTVIDGLTIGPHAGKPRQVARFGDRITHDADGTYTVHPATEDTP